MRVPFLLGRRPTARLSGSNLSFNSASIGITSPVMSRPYSTSRTSHTARHLRFPTNLRLSEHPTYLGYPHLCVSSYLDLSKFNPQAVELCLNRLALSFSPLLLKCYKPPLGDPHVLLDEENCFLVGSVCFLIDPT